MPSETHWSTVRNHHSVAEIDNAIRTAQQLGIVRAAGLHRVPIAKLREWMADAGATHKRILLVQTDAEVAS